MFKMRLIFTKDIKQRNEEQVKLLAENLELKRNAYRLDLFNFIPHVFHQNGEIQMQMKTEKSVCFLLLNYVTLI